MSRSWLISPFTIARAAFHAEHTASSPCEGEALIALGVNTLCVRGLQDFKKNFAIERITRVFGTYDQHFREVLLMAYFAFLVQSRQDTDSC